MRNNPLAAWLRALAPAFCLLALRRAGRGLPGWGRLWLEAAVLAAAVWLFCRESGKEGFRLSGKGCFLWIGLGALCGGALRLLFGKPAGPEEALGFLTVCVLGPACEETVYRGLVEDRLKPLLPGALSAAVSALLFAAAHEGPARMACALGAGLLFSLARRRTGSLTAPILMHMTVNLLSFV